MKYGRCTRYKVSRLCLITSREIPSRVYRYRSAWSDKIAGAQKIFRTHSLCDTVCILFIDVISRHPDCSRFHPEIFLNEKLSTASFSTRQITEQIDCAYLDSGRRNIFLFLWRRVIDFSGLCLGLIVLRRSVQKLFLNYKCW